MRKVFLENLERTYKGINWEASVGLKIKFIYDDIKGELPILDVIMLKGRNYIITEYEDCKNFNISTSSFSDCRIGGLLGSHTKRYKYNLGDILSIKSSQLEILKQIKMSNKKNTRLEKGYEYKCLNCGNIDIASEGNLNKTQGCNVCCTPTKKVLKGYNDLWTTHPDIAKMLKFPEVGHTQSFGSDVKQIFICKDCGCEKSMNSHNLINQGFCCPKCSDSTSYPEKITFSILQQLNLEFTCQLTKKIFGWCDNYRYDFYIPSINGILEINGLQHYGRTFEGIKSDKRARSLEEEQKNDRMKKQIAEENGIGNYITIDCRKSELEFIKRNILNSRLSELFNLSGIDWLKCHEFACKSLIKTTCELWDNGMKSALEISNTLEMDRCTIISYLKKGKILGWCDYDAKEVRKRTAIINGINISNLMKRIIICINTKNIYNSITEAAKELNVGITSIVNCCRGHSKSAGKDTNTNEKLVWMYYEDYLTQQLKDNIIKEAI